MTELKYYHGDGVKQDFPEHLDWFVPGLLKSINKLVADFEVKAIDQKVDYNKYEIVLTLKDREKTNQVIIDFKKINSLDNFVSFLIDSINEIIVSSLNGFVVIAYRPFNDSNITLTLGNWITLAKIEDFKNVINNPKKFQLSKNQTPKTYPGVKSFKDLNIKHHSQKFEGDYYLPFFPDDKFKQQTVELLNAIASLDKNNNVQFTVTSITTDDATVIFSENDKKTSIYFDIRDFDKIGHELNEFQGETDWKFVLIQPDEDSLIYAFCSQDELLTLEKYGFIREDYVKRR